ncbi:universal stress protein [Halobacillus rhizosphaerae]|uniref:universal stress protein n=1 Tax=Halobacillus rhizosphaerae TaxID=3064889 RepID=UPI00398BABE4
MNKFLVPIDGSDQSKRGLKSALKLIEGKESQTRLILIHVSIDSEQYAEAGAALNVNINQSAKAEGEELLQHALHSIPDGDLEVEIVHLEGLISQSIIDFSNQEKVDFIVMGGAGAGSISESILGSVSHQVLHHADAPVVIVK